MHAPAGRTPALAATAALTLLLAAPLRAAPELEKQADGIVVPIGDTFLKVEIRADNIIRVAAAKYRPFFAHPSLAVLPVGGPAPRWELTTAEGVARLLQDIGPGAIVLLHNGPDETLDILPDLLAGLKQQGYHLSTVSQALGK